MAVALAVALLSGASRVEAGRSGAGRVPAFVVDDDVSPRTAKIVLPTQATLQTSVLTALFSVEFAPQSQIVLSQGHLPLVVSLGGRRTEVGPNVHTVGIVSRPGVDLYPGSVVSGNVVTAGSVAPLGSSSVLGTVQEHATLEPLASLSWSVERTGGQNVRVPSGGIVSLPPGAFGSVTVLPGGRLKLDAGVYKFASLLLKAGGTVELPSSGRLVANIFDSWQSLGTWENAGGPSNTLFVFFGNEVTLKHGFIGTVVATDAQVGIGGDFVGAVFGREIEVSAGAKITHVPYQGWEAVVPKSLPTVCTASSLTVTDVDADFRDIWAGREQLATGKRTEAEPTIHLTFNSPVDSSLVPARLVGFVGVTDSDCVRDNGSIVVAQELHQVSLSVSPGATDREVTLVPTTRLRAGCEYHLIIDRFPVSNSGLCLAAPFQQPFLVADGFKSAFDREVSTRSYSAGASSAPTTFFAAQGVRTPTNDVFTRYRRELSLRDGIDDLTLTGPKVDSPFIPHSKAVTFRQTYYGIPVAGYGYWVESGESDDVFKAAMGRVLSGLTLPHTPAIPASEAVAIALRVIAPPKQPWLAPGSAIAPPNPQLLIKPEMSGNLTNARLVWRVDFSGIPEADYVDVDANTRDVRYIQRFESRASVPDGVVTKCEGFDPISASLVNHAMAGVEIPFGLRISETRPNLSLAQWQSGSTLFNTLNDTTPFIHRTRYASGSTEIGGDTAYVEFVCPGSAPGDANLSAIHWEIQQTEQTFSKFTLGPELSSDPSMPVKLPWVGHGGRSDIPLLVSLFDMQPDKQNSFFRRASTPPGQPGDTDEIVVGNAPPYLGIVAHEFAHGVMSHSLEALGHKSLELAKEPGALWEAYGDIMGAFTVIQAHPASNVDPWCMGPSEVLGVGVCERKIDDPKSSNLGSIFGGRPDTYLSKNFGLIRQVRTRISPPTIGASTRTQRLAATGFTI